jgi:hypothetical protein
VWQKTYGGTAEDFASSFQQTSDGGYVVAGYTNFGGYGALVLKLDANGNINNDSISIETNKKVNFGKK